jgi:hypothetical protein
MLDNGQYIGLSIQFTEVVRSCEVVLKKAAMVLDMSSGLCHSIYHVSRATKKKLRQGFVSTEHYQEGFLPLNVLHQKSASVSQFSDLLQIFLLKFASTQIFIYDT